MKIQSLNCVLTLAKLVLFSDKWKTIAGRFINVYITEPPRGSDQDWGYFVLARHKHMKIASLEFTI